jgi:hypothetical protein
MKIVIENIEFGFNEGCRLLKLKYDNCPFPALEDIWDEIKPMTFREIAEIENIEKRRVGVLCLGLERLISQVSPTLVDSKTIKKSTTFVDRKGEVVTKKFNDTYELYKVDGATFGSDRWNRPAEDCYFVKFKDTSTDREYLCWIDPTSVVRTNTKDQWARFEKPMQINAIQCIAWTFTTNVPEGNIEKMVRQGDCILIKPKNSRKKLLDTPRHLTEEEYRTLLVAES